MLLNDMLYENIHGELIATRNKPAESFFIYDADDNNIFNFVIFAGNGYFKEINKDYVMECVVYIKNRI